jgi:hypothetical protein
MAPPLDPESLLTMAPPIDPEILRAPSLFRTCMYDVKVAMIQTLAFFTALVVVLAFQQSFYRTKWSITGRCRSMEEVDLMNQVMLSAILLHPFECS